MDSSLYSILVFLMLMVSMTALLANVYHFAYHAIFDVTGGFGPFMSTSRVVGDYSTSVGVVNYQVDGADIASKIDDLDVIMTGGRLSVENKQVLTDAYNYFIQAHDVETADRVLMGLVTASPEFHTTNTRKFITWTKRQYFWCLTHCFTMFYSYQHSEENRRKASCYTASAQVF
jgi:hypothetical protein